MTGVHPKGVEGRTMEINHQCRHLLKGKGKQGSLSKGTYQETIRMRRLTVSEGEIRVNADEYLIIDDCSGRGG